MVVASRLIALILTAVLSANFSFAAGAARMPTGAAVPPLPQRHLSQVNWHDIQMLQAKKMKYYAAANREAAIKADVARYLNETERLGVFPDVPGFRDWLEKNSARISTAQMTKLMQDASVTEFTTAMYVSYTADVGVKMDRNAAMIAKAIPVAASAPSTPLAASAPASKDEAKSKGEEYFDGVLEKIQNNPFTVYVGATVAGAGGFLAAKAAQLLFFGPGVRVSNTVTDLGVSPILNRIDREINAKYAAKPFMIAYRRWWSGDQARAEKAVEQMEKGETLSADSARLVHPAVTLRKWADFRESFMKEMLTADQIWKGWDIPDNQNARNTGFELLFNQYTGFGERQNTYTVAISIAVNDFEKYAKELEKFKIQPDEIEAFERMVDKYQEVMVFEGPRHPDIEKMGADIAKVTTEWRSRGVPEKLISQFYGAKVDTIIAENRKMFSLVNYLFAELFYRENNVAMKDLPKLQALQESNREMSGLYRGLEEDRERIQRMFKKYGLDYDVQARIDERGFPLGGPPRPANVPPVRDPVDVALRDFRTSGDVPCANDYAKMKL